MHGRDLGIAVAELVDADSSVVGASSAPASVRVTAIAPHTEDRLEPESLADLLVKVAEQFGVTVIAIDGPSGWKDPDNGELHARRSERLARTPSKTGAPGIVKPSPYLPFTRLSIGLFDALDARGWPRVGAARPVRPLEVGAALDPEAGRVTVESFPWSTWWSLGLPPLPSKAKAKQRDLHRAFDGLARATGWALPPAAREHHDLLQALVALPAALELACARPVQLLGEPPRIIDGTVREGYILLPRPASPLPESL